MQMGTVTVGLEVAAMACQTHCQPAHHLFGAMQAENCMRACPTTCIFSKGDAPAAENALHKTDRHNPRNANKVLEAADWSIKK